MPSNNKPRLNVPVQPEMKKAVQEYANLNNISMNDVVRSALEEKLGIKDTMPSWGGNRHEATRRADATSEVC